METNGVAPKNLPATPASEELRYRLAAQRVKVANKSLRSLYKSSLSIGSTLEISQILESVVDCAKGLTHAEKAALVLLGPEGNGNLDFKSMIIKGRKNRLPDTLWRNELERVGLRAMHDYQPVVICQEDKMICVPLFIRGKGLGVLAAFNSSLDKITDDDIVILCIFANQAAVAVENSKLMVKEERLAVALERERIAREMHDGIAQTLFTIALNAEACRRLVGKKPNLVRQRLKELKQQAFDSQKDVRRLILDMKPGTLEELGLVAAVRQFLHSLGNNGRTRTRLTFEGMDEALHPITEISLYRILQEATTNAVKHASPTTLSVMFKFSDQEVVLTVRDNGKGFDVQRALKDTGCTGLGLRNMIDRAECAGGTLELKSSPGKGTTVKASIPVQRLGVAEHEPN